MANISILRSPISTFLPQSPLEKRLYVEDDASEKITKKLLLAVRLCCDDVHVFFHLPTTGRNAVYTNKFQRFRIDLIMFWINIV